MPELEVQKRIVKILEKVELLNEWRQESDKLTDDVMNSIFLDMFGDLNFNQKGWEIINFGKIISVLTDYHANGSYKILKKHVKLLSEEDYALMVRTTDLFDLQK